MFRIEPFLHQGKNYEVRATTSADGYTVQTFLKDKPVSPRYSIKFEVAFDFAQSGWGNAVDDMIETAKNDIVKGRLDELAKALKDAENPPV